MCMPVHCHSLASSRSLVRVQTTWIGGESPEESDSQTPKKASVHEHPKVNFNDSNELDG